MEALLSLRLISMPSFFAEPESTLDDKAENDWNANLANDDMLLYFAPRIRPAIEGRKSFNETMPFLSKWHGPSRPRK
jgi:hypothetical protein